MDLMACLPCCILTRLVSPQNMLVGNGTPPTAFTVTQSNFLGVRCQICFVSKQKLSIQEDPDLLV